jgi:uncharacterized RDD family membrane protein YckC
VNTDPLRYAGFWPRLGAILLDFVFLMPVTALCFWGSSKFRLFDVYFFVPDILWGLFYSVYLVRRWGGTPGKLIVGIRIRKLNGERVGYREAFLRQLPDFVLGLLISAALTVPLFRMTDAEYHALSFLERARQMDALAPRWYQPLHWLQTAWVWSELVVLLTNRKRRALHDFIAGTVVVHVAPAIDAAPQSAVAVPGH